MHVLVTGAGGFLGRRVVLALRRRDHRVRALDLRGADGDVQPGSDGIEDVRVDLCAVPEAELARMCEGVDAVVHLAARLSGDDASVVATTVTATERLLEGMRRAGTQRLVLASSLSVYDWTAARGVLDEDGALEELPGERDGYTTAKLRQEELARGACTRWGLTLTVLRPAVLWGAGRELPATIGPGLGPLQLVFAAARPLPVLHVDNCADAFAAVLDEPQPEGTFNVVDDPPVTALRFARDHLRRSGRGRLALPVPYWLGLASVAVVHQLTPRGLEHRLPGLAAPRRFAARYRPIHVDGTRLSQRTGWRPPLDYAQCLERTYRARGLS